MNFDGDPIWSPIKDNDLKFAVNTNWDVFQIESTKTFYLRHDKVWLKATSLKGPWSAAGPLPASFSKLPKDDNWSTSSRALPGGSVDVGSDGLREHDAGGAHPACLVRRPTRPSRTPS